MRFGGAPALLMWFAFGTLFPARTISQQAPQPTGATTTSQPAVSTASNGRGTSKKPKAIPDSSIYVGEAKLFDDRSLETMLSAAEYRLSTLQFLDQSSVANRVGANQGATLQQSQLSIQAEGPPVPQVVTKATTTTGKDAGTTRETDKTSPNISPSLPSLASGGPSSPSGFSLSAFDTLNEQVQLTYEVSNLRLLLEGSLNDRLRNPLTCDREIDKAQCEKQMPSWVKMKQRATIGFPISIQTPPGAKYDNAVAEVVVTVTAEAGPPGADPSPCSPNDPPGVINILPRERSYNEAKITDKATNIGFAAVTQVFSVGVAGSKRFQTYFVVQDLDTVAFQATPSADTKLDGCQTTFGWQFRPSLGRKRVLSGLRQTFVQLSFLTAGPEYDWKKLGYVFVRTRWRRYDPKTGVVGQVISETAEIRPQHLPSFNLRPDLPITQWSDADNGQVYIKVTGAYLSGTTVAAGANTWGEGMKGFILDTDGIRFVAPAQAFMANSDASIVSSGGYRTSLNILMSDQEMKNSSPLRILRASAKRWSDQESEVTICYMGGVQTDSDKVLVTNSDKVLVLAAGTVYGLSDHPVRRDDEPHCVDKDKNLHSLQFHAPTKALRTSGTVHIKQILRDEMFSDIQPIRFANDFTATGLTKIAKSDTCSLYVIQGSQLARANKGQLEPRVSVRLGTLTVDRSPHVGSCEFGKMSTPGKAANSTPAASSPKGKNAGNGQGGGKAQAGGKKPASTCDPSQAYLDAQLGPSALLLAAPDCLLNETQSVAVFLRDAIIPDDVQLVLLPLTATKAATAQVTLDKIEVQQGAKSVVLKGQHLELITLTSFVFTNFENQPVTAKIASDESSIEMTIPDAISSKPGNYALNYSLNDGSKTQSAVLLSIKKPANSTDATGSSD
jgi:hypothetical protein